MRAVVIFETMFGNTRTIAKAVADGLASHVDVDIVEVGSAPRAVNDDVTLLVVGGPTHAFGLSRPRTREDAAQRGKGPVVSERIGLREWLDDIQKHPPTVAAAAFDTRIRKPLLPGSAARGAQKRLRRLGFRMVAPPQSFWVTGTTGPLADGETERARRWGDELGAQVAAEGRERHPGLA